MQFIFADTLDPSIAKLNLNESKQAKTSLYDLQIDPANPGLRFHRVERARDPNFWSIRVNRDVRIIIHRTDKSFVVCYADHHDKAYKWAENRKGMVHPKTGAFQFVKIRELVEDIVIRRVVEEIPSANPIFESIPSDTLLAHGVPEEWLQDVMTVTDEDDLLAIVEHLPVEASDALLELATGGSPAEPTFDQEFTNPFEHPDAKRRFYVLEETGDDSLAHFLDQPLSVWRFFLHPSQRTIVENNWRGPFRAVGAPGTGKTVCAMHRCRFILEQKPDAKVLFTTYDSFLARDIREELKTFIRESDADRYDVIDLDTLVAQKLRELEQKSRVIKRESGTYKNQLKEAARLSALAQELGNDFLEEEFYSVILEQGITTSASYLRADRRGRQRAFTASQKIELFPVFEEYRRLVNSMGNVFQEDAYWWLINEIRAGSWHSGYSDVIVDEVQDFGRAGLTLIANLAETSDTNQPQVFLVGDQNQRIFGRKYSFSDCGLSIQGRARRLKKNYRTSAEIFSRSLDVLNKHPDPGREDEDDLAGTFSSFSGPEPTIRAFLDSESEMLGLCSWLKNLANHIPLHEICIVSQDFLGHERVRKALERETIDWHVIRGQVGDIAAASRVRLSTLDRIKGLEFSAVAIVGMGKLEQHGSMLSVDDEIRGRNRLFVAMTRAKSELYVSYHGAPSKYLGVEA
ncbi:3'-5' exonuclease [Pseudomonadales bacterium]|jgi:hypothetical protein|nr:3'-5' exonuclease [Pseudomonadales bacterium]